MKAIVSFVKNYFIRPSRPLREKKELRPNIFKTFKLLEDHRLASVFKCLHPR